MQVMLTILNRRAPMLKRLSPSNICNANYCKENLYEIFDNPALIAINSEKPGIGLDKIKLITLNF